MSINSRNIAANLLFLNPAFLRQSSEISGVAPSFVSLKQAQIASTVMRWLNLLESPCIRQSLGRVSSLKYRGPGRLFEYGVFGK